MTDQPAFHVVCRTKDVSAVKLGTAAVLALVASSSGAVEVQMQNDVRFQSTDSRIAEQVRLSRMLVTLPDGSHIATINNRQASIVLKPGDTVRIVGKGFDQRRDKSVVGLFLPGVATGALLDIVSWTDSVIVARVPADNVNLKFASANARLKVVPIRANGLMLEMNVAGIRLDLPPRAIRTVELIGLPEWMIRLQTRPGWVVERQPKAAPGAIGPGPGAAVYVKRVRGTANRADCEGSFVDIVDLTQVRRNGFRLVDYRKAFFGSRAGLTIDDGGMGPRRGAPVGKDETGRTVLQDGDLRTVAKVEVVDGIINYRFPGSVRFCDAGYRLHLTVEGPADIDPITGNKIRPKRVN